MSELDPLANSRAQGYRKARPPQAEKETPGSAPLRPEISSRAVSYLQVSREHAYRKVQFPPVEKDDSKSPPPRPTTGGRALFYQRKLREHPIVEQELSKLPESNPGSKLAAIRVEKPLTAAENLKVPQTAKKSADAAVAVSPPDPDEEALRTVDVERNQYDGLQLDDNLGGRLPKSTKVIQARASAVEQLSRRVENYIPRGIIREYDVLLACSALGRIGKQAAGAEPLLIRAIHRHSDYRQLQINAARALADIGASSPEAVAAVGSLISFRKDSFDDQLVYALSKMGEPGLKCAEMKIDQAGTEGKWLLIPHLVYFQDRAAPLLSRYLSDPSTSRAAAETIQEIGAPAAGCLPKLKEVCRQRKLDDLVARAVMSASSELNKPADYYHRQRLELLSLMEGKLLKGSASVSIGTRCFYFQWNPDSTYDFRKTKEGWTLQETRGDLLRWDIDKFGKVIPRGRWQSLKFDTPLDYTSRREGPLPDGQFKNVNEILEKCVREGYRLR